MSGDRRGRESTEKERDGEAKLRGSVLAGGLQRCCWGGPWAVHGGGDAGRDAGAGLRCSQGLFCPIGYHAGTTP